MAGTRALPEFRKLTLDAVHVGEQFVSDDHLVLPADVEAHGFAVEDDHPWLADGLAPPTLMANQALHLRHSKYIVHAGLHAKMAFEFVEPIRVGGTVLRGLWTAGRCCRRTCATRRRWRTAPSVRAGRYRWRRLCDNGSAVQLHCTSSCELTELNSLRPQSIKSACISRSLYYNAAGLVIDFTNFWNYR